MEDYIKISVLSEDTELREILLARMFELGFEGFEEQNSFLNAYIPSSRFKPKETELLLQDHSFSVEPVPDENWNSGWESGFSPVRIGSFCGIRAPFHSPIMEVKHEIIIAPKMSFGTGHHPSTSLVIELMAGLPLCGKAFLDFGTGTGLLAILARKMGARRVLAIDNDGRSLSNARENAGLNGISGIQFQTADSLFIEESFYYIAANISRAVLLANLNSVQQHLEPGGVFLMSGLLKSDKEIMKEAAKFCRLMVVKEVEKEGWIALALQLS